MQEFLILGKGMTTHPSVPASLLGRRVRVAGRGNLPRRRGCGRTAFHYRAAWGRKSSWRPRARRAATTSRCLQQLAQREHGTTPTYQLLDEKGPDHSKCFKVAAQIGGNRYQAAWGRNKKEAEQRAARNALSQLGGEVPPFASD